MCTNCNQNQYQEVHICNECQEEPCVGCPVKDLSTDCVNFDQDPLLYGGVEVVPTNTTLTLALDKILQFIKIKIEEIQNKFRLINTGTGASIYSGNNLLGEKKLRKIKSADNSVVIVEGTDDINLSVVAATPPDGSETKLQNGNNTTILGSGTIANPYSVNVTFPAQIIYDGSETKLQNGTNTTVTGSGTIASPYSVNVDIPAVEEQVLEKVGTGIIRRGRDESNYVTVGYSALDLSYSYATGNGVSGSYSVITNGEDQKITSNYSGILSGYKNRIFSNHSSILGGSRNTIDISSTFSTILGGVDNIIQSNSTTSSLVGGNVCEIKGEYGFVGGGKYNKILLSSNEAVVVGGDSNTVNKTKGFIGGGYKNTVNSFGGSIIGGSWNQTEGDLSSVLGGYRNVAYSYCEISAGTNGTSYVPVSTTDMFPTDRLFNLGNGNDTTKSDAFTILKNGLATLPSVTTALISAASNKAVVTKEYLESLDNLQKVITGSYTVTSADNNHTIFINNGATAVTITIPTGLLAKLNVGFVQQGTGLVSFVASGTTINTPTGLKIKGQNYQAYIEKVGSTEVFHLLGNVIA